VTDREILEAQSWLAQTEGIFVEPASAAPIAGLFRLTREKRRDLIPQDATVVCTCTGHGLKDSEIVSAKFSETAPLAPNIEAVREAITRS
jgi:threonine synthase